MIIRVRGRRYHYVRVKRARKLPRGSVILIPYHKKKKKKNKRAK